MEFVCQETTIKVKQSLCYSNELQGNSDIPTMDMFLHGNSSKECFSSELLTKQKGRKLERISSLLNVIIRYITYHSPLSQGGHIARETKKALFYHAKPHPHGFHCEA